MTPSEVLELAAKKNIKQVRGGALSDNEGGYSALGWLLVNGIYVTKSRTDEVITGMNDDGRTWEEIAAYLREKGL